MGQEFATTVVSGTVVKAGCTGYYVDGIRIVVVVIDLVCICTREIVQQATNRFEVTDGLQTRSCVAAIDLAGYPTHGHTNV